MAHISINSVYCYSTIIKVLKLSLKWRPFGFSHYFAIGACFDFVVFQGFFQKSLLISRESAFLKVYCAVLVMGSGLWTALGA